MKKYRKIIDGKEVIMPRNKIVVIKDDRQFINPKEDMLFADGWEEYVTPIYEPTVEDLRVIKQDEILDFDSSDEVNAFFMQGRRIWIDKATRAGLMLRFQAEMASGQEQTTLWYKGQQFPLLLSQAVQMLYAIELYASKCYDVTQAHLANVERLLTIESIESYDYTAGYPEMLNF